jgi:hypothetical protein
MLVAHYAAACLASKSTAAVVQVLGLQPVVQCVHACALTVVTAKGSTH